MSRERGMTRTIEVREKPPEQKVRMFLFQSRTPDILQDAAGIPDDLLDSEGHIQLEQERDMIARLDFTDMVLLRKSKEAVNSGQLMPIGGAVEDGESLVQAIERETNEEAHLRTTRNSTIRLGAEQTYSFEHPKKGTVNNHATFFVGRLLPGDTPFPLDNAEDKIGSFERVSVKEYIQLFGPAGSLTRDGRTMRLLGSLQKDPSQRTEKTEQQDVEQVHTELHAHFQMIEGDKKLDVLKHLLLMRIQQATDLMSLYERNGNTAAHRIASAHHRHMRALLHTQSGMSEELRELRDSIQSGNAHLHDADTHAAVQKQYSAITTIWKTITEDLSVSIEDVQVALDLSNTEASVEYATNTELNLETGVGIPTITLFFPILLGDRFADNRLKQQYLKILMEHPATAHMVRLAQSIDTGLADEKDAGDILESLEQKGVFSLRHAEQYQVQEGITDESAMRSYSRVLDTYFDRLLEEAGVADDVPVHPLDAIRTDALPEGQEFETLAAFAMGIHPVFDEPTTDPDALAYREQLRWEASRKLLLANMLDETVGIQANIQEKGIAPIEDLERTVLAEVEGVTRTKDREKSLLSLFRKMIVRDELSERVARDHFAETLFFEPGNHDEMESRQTPVPDGLVITDKKGQQLDSIDAPPTIVTYLQRLQHEHAQKNDGGTLRISEFKSPKRGGHDSAGPGGGGDVFFWKWYIDHEAADGTVRSKEVHAYASQPTTDGGIKTAQAFFDEKLEDDQRYAVRRLFSTAGLRSFMELLFPAHIYGDEARAMYKDVVSEKKFKKAQQQSGS